MKDTTKQAPHHRHHQTAARVVEAISTTPQPGVIAPFSEMNNKNAPARRKEKLRARNIYLGKELLVAASS